MMKLPSTTSQLTARGYRDIERTKCRIRSKNQSSHFTHDASSFLFKNLHKWVKISSNLLKIAPSEVVPSKREFATAMRKANTDLNFLSTRRDLRNENSQGKISGVLLFRLCRHRIVHFSPSTVDREGTDTLQDMALINLILTYQHINADREWSKARAGRIHVLTGEHDGFLTAFYSIKERASFPVTKTPL